MHTISAILLAAAALACAAPSRAQPAAPAADVAALQWMSGCWRIDGREPGSGEMWTLPVGGTMLGVGHIVRKGQLSEYEYMRIERRADGGLAFVAKPSRQAEAEFRMTALTADGVTFENPAHDFPQRIAYRLEADGSMTARVEARKGDAMRGFTLVMRRADCR